jgi:hypothetical protein
VAAFVDADGTTPGIIDAPLGWRPDVAVAGDVALLTAVTNSIASATTDLAGAIMTADGTFPGGMFLISAADDKQLRPAVSWNGSEFILAWEDKRNAVIYFDERTDIYGSRVAASGEVLDPLGVPISVMTAPEMRPALLSIGTSTLLAVSTLRTESDWGAYRIGIRLQSPAAGIDESSEDIVQAAHLIGARPNPAISGTSIRFQPAASQPVTLRIFSADGRRVRTLIDGEVFNASSATEIFWDGLDDRGRRAGAGVYFYELRTWAGASSRRLVVLR